jgi:hypothetical protein
MTIASPATGFVGLGTIGETTALNWLTLREADIASPLIDVSSAPYGQAGMLGLGDDEMVAVIRAIERRTAAIP